MLEEFESLKIKTLDDINTNMKKIESMIRTSKEYRNYIAFVFENFQMKDPFFSKYELEDVTLEVHHIIFLYELVLMVGCKLLENTDSFILTFDIAKAVIELHLDNKIPVVILPKNLHELYHSGQYNFIENKCQIHKGEYKEFFKEFKDYFSEKNFKIYKDMGVLKKDLEGE